jgi:aspartyl-tRNA(Asn)/glutamyl-tRNA(Gln) amidotransferase subunit A
MDLASLTIHEARDGLSAKKFSSVDLTEACFKNIHAKNDDLNAYVTICEESAMAEAKAADDRLAKGKDHPLCGIPVGLKDVFCTDGIETTACSNILRGFVPPYDATTVAKLKAAGAVILGKLNTDEFTCGTSTETSCFGVTKNPWDTERVPGGSSGGSAAAVAANMCIYAMGTDTGGSIRQPASFCNITGLKVTYGRISRYGVISMASSLDTIGPMTKDVEDAAIVLQALAGKDKYDATTPDVAVPDYLAALSDLDLKGVKIGLPKEYFIEGMDPDVEKAVREAVVELEKQGAIVKEISLPHTEYGVAVYYIISPSEVSANMARYDGIRFGPVPDDAKDLMSHYLEARAKGFGPEMKRRIMVGTHALSSGYYDAYYVKAQKVRTLVKNDFDEAFKKVDVICAPVAPTPAFKIGEHVDDPVKMYLNDLLAIPSSLAGITSLAVPCGFSSGGLPIGMQIMGPQFEEARVLGVGSAYQVVTDFHTKRPPSIAV